MKMSLEINLDDMAIDIDHPIDISVPLRFNGAQPNAYGAEGAVSHACVAGDLIGDTRRGGSCNFERYTFVPHCNGTHTECVGHITNERFSVRDCLQDVFVSAVLISVVPDHDAAGGDSVITRPALESALERTSRRGGGSKALIVRTLPNDDSKLTCRYDREFVPPYFAADAMRLIVGLEFEHLLVDLPSIDRIYDGGKLENHRLFWNVEPGSFETNEQTRMHSTITELVYASESVPDGRYLLNLQIAPFAADASPSRPVLFRVG